MAIGRSGRVVVDIDPELKREFYAALQHDGKSLKDWFINSARRYIETHRQTELVFEQKAESTP